MTKRSQWRFWLRSAPAGARCARAWLQNETVLPPGDEVVGWVEEARLRVVDAANNRSLPVRDFATTVVMAVSDAADTITAHIGDGAIVARCTATDERTALSWPAHGEYASMTSFLTDDELALRVATLPGEIDRLAVLTDGIERLALDFGAHAPHAPFFDSVARRSAIARTLGGARHCPLPLRRCSIATASMRGPTTTRR